MEQLVSGLVVQGERLGVELNPAALLDIAHGVLDDGEGLQPQEIHLEQARVFRHRVVELRAHHVAVLGRGYRNELGDVVWGDDDPASMDAGVAHRAFDHARLLEHL